MFSKLSNNLLIISILRMKFNLCYKMCIHRGFCSCRDNQDCQPNGMFVRCAEVIILLFQWVKSLK